MNKRVTKFILFCISILILMFIPFFASSISEMALNAMLKRDGHLPFIGNQEKFEKLLRSSPSNYYRNDPIIVDFGGLNRARTNMQINRRLIDDVAGDIQFAIPSFEGGGMYISPSSKQETPKTPSYSETNTQVKGIDEADIVKNDGKYIYSISNNKLVITNAYPASELKVLSTTELGTNMKPYEMFISENNLFMISLIQSSNNRNYPYYSNNEPTVITIFDISDRANPVQVKYFETSSRYLSSRKSGNKVYVIVNQNVASSNDLPKYKQNEDTNYTSFTFEEMMYVPNSVYNTFLTILSFDLEAPKAKPHISPYLGGGDMVYMSKDNLYLAVSVYGNSSSRITHTNIYKFDVTSGKPVYQSRGDVPGYIINQFAMDEYDGNFRIATTTQGGSNDNNVYVLNSRMSRIGSVTNLARNETIKSVRFVGDKGYVVTFRQMDPLFVIDLSNPRFPKLLGELKIPGYSTYLHPYDDTHVIGFGYDGNLTGGTNGKLRLAIFDISDVKTPREMFVEKIDARNSDLLTNHKALLFDKERELIAFPIRSWNKNTGEVYTINLTDGFKKRGSVEHKNNTAIDRLLYIEDNIYSVSNNEIKANNINTIEEVNDVLFQF